MFLIQELWFNDPDCRGSKFTNAAVNKRRTHAERAGVELLVRGYLQGVRGAG